MNEFIVEIERKDHQQSLFRGAPEHLLVWGTLVDRRGRREGYVQTHAWTDRERVQSSWGESEEQGVQVGPHGLSRTLALPGGYRRNSSRGRALPLKAAIV